MPANFLYVFSAEVYLSLLSIFQLGCFSLLFLNIRAVCKLFIVVVELYELIVYFGNESLVSCIISKYFLPVYMDYF